MTDSEQCSNFLSTFTGSCCLRVRPEVPPKPQGACFQGAASFQSHAEEAYEQGDALGKAQPESFPLPSGCRDHISETNAGNGAAEAATADAQLHGATASEP